MLRNNRHAIEAPIAFQRSRKPGVSLTSREMIARCPLTGVSPNKGPRVGRWPFKNSVSERVRTDLRFRDPRIHEFTIPRSGSGRATYKPGCRATSERRPRCFLSHASSCSWQSDKRHVTAGSASAPSFLSTWILSR